MERADMTETTDPFSGAQDASRETCEIRSRAFARPEVGCDVISKPKRQRIDFSPQQRRHFEREGWTFARVEAANAWGGMTVDLWTFGDWLVCKSGEGIMIVQTCRHSDASTRLRKAKRAPELAVWLESGGRFQVHGWRQLGEKGSRWERVVREVKLEDL